MAENLTAFATLGTLIVALIAFWYSNVGQSPTVEVYKRKIFFSEPPVYEIGFRIRNRRRHQVYVINPTLRFPLGRPCSRKRSEISIKIEQTFSIDENQFTIDGIYLVEPGGTLDVDLSIEIRLKDLIGKPFPHVLPGHHPVIYVKVREYTPFKLTYTVSEDTSSIS